MSHFNSRYNDSPDAWPLTSSCGGGCGGSAPRIGASPMPQRFDESWQPDYVPKAAVSPRMTMSRYFPDEQPDAVLPRYGVQRPMPSGSYDDYPDSPHFYTPRSPMMMQPPGIQTSWTLRPWDDGPDTDNFYRQTSHSPQIRQVITARPWDDGPDTDNFYRQANGGPPARQAITTRPWDDGPDTDNFYKQASPSIRARQGITSRPWDDGPDTDNFYKQSSPSLPVRRAATARPWDDYPDTDNFYKQAFVSLPGYPVQQVVEKYPQPDHVATRLTEARYSNFGLANQVIREASSPSLYTPTTIVGTANTGTPLALSPTFVPPTKLSPVGEPSIFTDPRYWPAYQNSRAVGKTFIDFGQLLNPGQFQSCRNNFLLDRNVIVMPDFCTRTFLRTGRFVAKDIVQVLFGSFDSILDLIDPPTNPFHRGGRIDIARRLIALGIPSDDQRFLNLVRLFHDHPGFSCHRLLSGRNIPPKNHDLAYFMCDPIEARYRLSNLRWRGMNIPNSYDFRVKIYPGDVFGWIPLEEPSGYAGGGLAHPYEIPPPNFKEGAYVYYLTFGQWPDPWLVPGTTPSQLRFPFLHKGKGIETIFLSLGGKIINTRYPDTFTTSEAFRSGLYLSGGAIINQQTNKAIGVAMESIPLPQEFNVDKYPEVVSPSWNRGDVKNAYFMSPFPNSTNAYAYTLVAASQKRPPSPPPFPIIPSGGTTKWVGGGNVLQAKTLMCPEGYLAAGVVGSSAERISGNMGIICLPFSGEHDYQFHKAVVNAGGCSATWIPPAHQMNFQDYISRVPAWFVPSTPEAAIRRGGGRVVGQSFAMCPPGFYLTGMMVEHGYANPPDDLGPGQQVVTIIMGIECRYWDEMELDYARFAGIGEMADVVGSTTSFERISCGKGRMFANGIQIDASKYTNGFRLTCAGVPNFVAKPYP